MVAGQHKLDEVVPPAEEHSIVEAVPDLPEIASQPLEADSHRQRDLALQKIEESEASRTQPVSLCGLAGF